MQWIDQVTWGHPSWPPERVRAEAEEITKNEEIVASEVLYMPTQWRIAQSGRQIAAKFGPLEATATNGGRMFTFTCKCGLNRRVTAVDLMPRVIEAAAAGVLEIALSDLLP